MFRDILFEYKEVISALSMSAAVWTVNQVYKDPPNELIYLMAIIAIILFIIAIWTFIWGKRKPKPFVIECFTDFIKRANALVFEKIESITDKVMYETSVEQWFRDVEKLLSEEVSQEDVHMFVTMTPMFTKNANSEFYKLYVSNRIEKLRQISGRYIKGENIR